MRLHTCLHLLCTVVDAGVTGGAIDTHKARLDFDLPEPTLDKAKIAVELNRLIKEDRAVEARWITDEQLAAPPERDKPVILSRYDVTRADIFVKWVIAMKIRQARAKLPNKNQWRGTASFVGGPHANELGAIDSVSTGVV